MSRHFSAELLLLLFVATFTLTVRGGISTTGVQDANPFVLEQSPHTSPTAPLGGVVECETEDQTTQIVPSADVDSWNLEMINAPAAWNITKGSEEIVVAVIDSGIVWQADELPTSHRWENTAEVNGETGVDDDRNGYVDDLYGYDFAETPYDNNPSSDTSSDPLLSHGTNVGAIIAALHDSDQVAGVAPNVSLMNIRMLDCEGYFWEMQQVVDAFHYAVANNASVINFSIYFNSPAFYFPDVIDAFEQTVAAGIPIIGIAGNVGQALYPGDESTVIATAALDSTKSAASFSIPGTHVEFAAPGAAVPSIDIHGNVEQVYGTSFAAPHLAATVALMRSLRYDLSEYHIRWILRLTAEDIDTPGKDWNTGYGLVDAYEAVLACTEFEQRDFDGDGLNTSLELQLGTSPYCNDSDTDGMDDGWEYYNGLDPTTDDSNDDLDADGLDNIDEYDQGTLANDADTDSDGMPDGWEVEHQLAPLDPMDADEDPDEDGLINVKEFEHDTDPWNPDTDGDGADDGAEVDHGRDPDSSSFVDRVLCSPSLKWTAILLSVLLVTTASGVAAFLIHTWNKQQ